jgi:hypothetical protein
MSLSLPPTTVAPRMAALGRARFASGRRRRLDRLDLLVLVAFLAVSQWVVGLDVWRLATHGQAWTGAAGVYPVDQLQYLAWMRDASRHGLASDLFVVRQTPHDYLEPLVALGGGLVAGGVPPWLALLALQLLAVLALFLVVRAYCRRLLSGTWAPRTALVLALFYGSYGVLGDEWIPFETWGYVPAVVSIAALGGALLAYDRCASGGGALWAAPLLGLLAAWLHPWQGQQLLLIVVGVELVALARWGRLPMRRRRALLASLTIAATALPLAYYAALDHLDPIWRLAQAHASRPWPLATALAPLAPLAAVAAAGSIGSSDGFLRSATRAWPLAALGAWALCEAGFGSSPLHAFGGVTIPLAVLAVQALKRTGAASLPGFRWGLALVVAAATIPASLHMMRSLDVANAFIPASEQRAIDYLAADPRPGGVLTTFNPGSVIPADTGRHSYVGDCFWSVPGCQRRAQLAWDLFYVRLKPAKERRIVTASGARFVLVPCGARPRLREALAPLVVSARRFGCAAVYLVDPAPAGRRTGPRPGPPAGRRGRLPAGRARPRRSRGPAGGSASAVSRAFAPVPA